MKDRAVKKVFSRRLYITIDTEMDADIHWKKANPPEFSSVLEGIPELLRPIWDRYNVTPIYFVSPEVVENEACCEVLREEIKKGAVIGAHLHPEYISPCKKEPSDIKAAEFPCNAYTRDIERQKIKNLACLIEHNLGVKPEWYRAARFGADADTMAILQGLGFKYDSSLTPGIDWSSKGGPDHRRTPLHSYYLNPSDIYSDDGLTNGVREYPVTILGKRFGFLGKIFPDLWLLYRWIRPSHMSYLEQKHMIRKLKKTGITDIVMMFHSMEVMVGKTPYVRTKWMQKYFLWRLEKTIRFARRQGYRGTFYKED